MPNAHPYSPVLPNFVSNATGYDFYKPIANTPIVSAEVRNNTGTLAAKINDLSNRTMANSAVGTCRVAQSNRWSLNGAAVAEHTAGAAFNYYKNRIGLDMWIEPMKANNSVIIDVNVFGYAYPRVGFVVTKTSLDGLAIANGYDTAHTLTDYTNSLVIAGYNVTHADFFANWAAKKSIHSTPPIPAYLTTNFNDVSAFSDPQMNSFRIIDNVGAATALCYSVWIVNTIGAVATPIAPAGIQRIYTDDINVGRARMWVNSSPIESVGGMSSITLTEVFND